MHEIYLADPRKIATDKLRTIIRTRCDNATTRTCNDALKKLTDACPAICSWLG